MSSAVEESFGGFGDSGYGDAPSLLGVWVAPQDDVEQSGGYGRVGEALVAPG